MRTSVSSSATRTRGMVGSRSGCGFMWILPAVPNPTSGERFRLLIEKAEVRRMRTHPLRWYWRQILKQQAVLWHRETDGEAIGTPVPGDLAPELALHGGATQHTAEADVLVGRIDGGAATLLPDDDQVIALVGAVDIDAAIACREGAVLGGIGGELVQQRSEEHTSELQSLMRLSYAVF